MSNEIIVALIGAIPAILVAVVSIVSNNQIVQVKIEELTKKVEKHNEIVERTYKLESDMKTAFNKIDEGRGRIERLEDREMK